MAVITLLNPKGGAGKTTSALVLGTGLAQRGYDVCMIDADPLGWLTRWAMMPGKPETLTVVSGVTDETIADRIESVSEDNNFVIIDLEGSTSLMGGLSVAMSDLILTPVQGSSMDAEAAGQAFQMVASQAKALRRQLAHSVVLTRTSAAIQSRDLKAIREQMSQAGVDVLPTALVERAAYRSLFAYGGTIWALPRAEVSNIDKAEANAVAFVDDVLTRLMETTNE